MGTTHKYEGPDPVYQSSAIMSSFIEKLNAEALEYFNNVASSPFDEQCVAFFNAYWAEVGSQAEYCFSVAWEIMKECDMEAKGISLVHKYSQGCDVDFDIGLRFYECICNHWEKPQNAKWHEYELSNPGEIITSIKRKQELRDKVDVNFDGRISMLEYLLYQYKDFVDEVSNVVGHVEGLGCSSRIVNLAKEVTCWVDGPAQAHDDTHVVKRLLDGFGRGARRLSGFPSKDLEEDESPAAQTQSEASPWIDCLGLTSVTEGKHANGANQEFPEASWANRCFRGFQDEVELDHL